MSISHIPHEDDKPYRPITFTRYIWERCKSQPIVPAGCAATVVALVGATLSLRTGNRKNFNYWLRMRVLAQGATVVAMVVYGSVALTRQEQTKHYIKSQIMLGDLPPDTQWPGRKPGEAAPEVQRRPSRSEDLSSRSADGEPSAGLDAAVGPGGAYPLAKKDRIKASEFARRMQEAEAMQKEEDARKAARKAAREAAGSSN